MISYVDCLAGASPVSNLTPPCLSPSERDDVVRLVPRNPNPVQINPLHPRGLSKPNALSSRVSSHAEGSLRRRLLSARVHHQYAALQTHTLQSTNGSAAWGPEQEVKKSDAEHGRRNSDAVLNTDLHPGFTRTHPLYCVDTPIFRDQAVNLLQSPPPQFKYKPKKRRRWFRGKRKNAEASSSTPLIQGGNCDKKWSVHYTTQKPLHGLLFLPSTTRGSEELSSPEPVYFNPQHAHAQSSTGSMIHQSQRRRSFKWQRSRKMKSRFRDCFSQSCFWVCLKFSVWTQKSSTSDSDDDERLVVGGTQPLTPLILTDGWEGPACCVDDGTSSGLPTPEEVTRRQAQSVMADIVAINITGESFDRQASLHRSLSQQDAQNRKHSVRRTGQSLDLFHNQDHSQDPDLIQSPTQSLSRTSDRIQTSTQSLSRSSEKYCESQEVQEQVQRRWTERRCIRAPRGDLFNLMNSLTSSECSQKIPHSTSCLQSPHNSTYRAMYYSPADREAQCDNESLCSSVLKPWRYQSLSPSSSLHSAQDSGSVCGESWNCEPLLCTGSTSHQSLSSCQSNSQDCSQMSLNLDQNPLHFSQTHQQNGDKMTASFSLDFYENYFPSCHSSCSESTLNNSQVSLDLEDKSMSSSCSLSLSCSSQMSLSQFEQSEKRFSVSSNSSSASRSFSLIKSKRPPAPPVRNESLKRPRVKPKRMSLERKIAEQRNPNTSAESPLNERVISSVPVENVEMKKAEEQRFISSENAQNKGVYSSVLRLSRKRAEGLTMAEDLVQCTFNDRQVSSPVTAQNQRVYSPDPAEFGDPWVPRMKKRQSGLNCGTTTTFAPMEELKSTAGTSSATFTQDLEHLSSPSSGYSSQSNTPLSSPISPPEKDPSKSPSESHKNKCKSKSRSKSRSKCGLKPRPPERSTSLLSSPQTSNTNLPEPPPPPSLPPLPVCNQQFPVFGKPSNTGNIQQQTLSENSNVQKDPKRLPSPPPLPVGCVNPPSQRDNSQFKSSVYRNSKVSPPSPLLCDSLPNLKTPPLPPPAPPLPSSFCLPPPPPLPPSPQTLPDHNRILNHTPPNVPQTIFDETIHQSSLPSLQLSPTRYTQVFEKSKMSPFKTSPLVTAQALQNVKLRTVKKQEFTRTNSLPAMDSTQPEDSQPNHKLLRKKANSFVSINPTPEDETKEKKAKNTKCNNELLDEKSLKVQECPNTQQATDPTAKTVSGMNSNIDLSIKHIWEDVLSCATISETNNFTNTKSNSEEVSKTSDISISFPNLLKGNSDVELVVQCMYEKSEGVSSGENKEDLKTIRNAISKQKQSLEKKQEISIEEIETVLRNLDASVEDFEGESIYHTNNTDSITAENMISDTKNGQNESQSLDLKTKQKQRNEPCLKQDNCQRILSAEIRSCDIKIQKAQITNVRQYKLQTTENYFRMQNMNDLDQNSPFKERNQAYLDMYAMLAQNMASKPDRVLESKNVQEMTTKSKSQGKAYYNMNDVCNRMNGLDIKEALEERDLNKVSDKLWVKKENCDKVEEEAQYWSMCREIRPQKSELNPDLVSGHKEHKKRSLVKPALPKKPDLGILGLLNKTTKRENPVEKISPAKAESLKTNSLQQEKPPVFHRKPNLATQRQNKDKMAMENTEDYVVWSIKKVENQSPILNTTAPKHLSSHKGNIYKENAEEGKEVNDSVQNCSTNLNYQETERNPFRATFIEDFERCESCNNAVWEGLEARETEHFKILEQGQNSWVESMENLGSCKKKKVSYVENLKGNILYQRKTTNDFQVIEHELDVSWQNCDKSSGKYCRQNIKMESGILRKDVLDFERENKNKSVPMKKPERKKRNVLMQNKSLTSSSPSSSSSSSFSESDVESSHAIGHSCSSLSSALSTESLKGELFLPALSVQEPGEEEQDVFVGVCSDQVTVSDQNRSTDDLFAVIHSPVWEGIV